MRTTIQRIALSGLAVTWGWLGFVAGIHAQSVLHRRLRGY